MFFKCISMKKNIFIFLIVCVAIFVSCSENSVKISPKVPYRIELNDSVYHIGDSLYGRVVIIEDSLVAGTKIEKIDCRLANIVIGNVENEKICPFGIRLVDTPVGVHTFSVIIKCKAPDCDETYWRYDSKIITIKE